jgi:N-acetylneuraminate synthase
MKNVILVGEIGINHNGSVEIANKLVSIANAAGLDYVKFQKRDIKSCYTKKFLDSPRESPYGTTQGDQKEGIELTIEGYNTIDAHCRIIKMGWFASPWDPISVEFIARFNVPYIKVGSACITDFEILEAIKRTQIPVIISVGMSTKEEVDKCISYLGKNRVEYILACKSTYPTADEDMNMRFITTLKQEYPKFKIGFSNHNSGIQFCLGAIFLGAEMIEFHMTLDRSMYGSDQSASIETTGVFKLGEHTRAIEVGMGTGEWTITPDEEKIREKLRK